MRIKWLRKANNNLDEIATYISQYDQEAAKKIYALIRKSVAELMAHPELRVSIK